MELHDYTGRIERSIGLAQRCDHSVPSPVCRTEIHEEHLIPIVMDDATEFRTQSHHILSGQLAFEYGELKMVAIAAHNFEDLAKPFVVGDVVADQVGFANALSSADRS